MANGPIRFVTRALVVAVISTLFIGTASATERQSSDFPDPESAAAMSAESRAMSFSEKWKVVAGDPKAIADVAGAGVPGETDGSNLIFVRNDYVRIARNAPAVDVSNIRIELPVKGETRKFVSQAKGTVVFAGSTTGFAIQATGSGARLVPVKKLLGAENDTGEILIIGNEGQLLGGLDAPWADDAAGNPAATSYSTKGSYLIQTISPTKSAQFPTIADPSAWAVTKCVAAITALVGGVVFVGAKLLAAARAIKAFGGVRATVRLIMVATTWAERRRSVHKVFGSLAAEILGIAAIEDYYIKG